MKLLLLALVALVVTVVSANDRRCYMEKTWFGGTTTLKEAIKDSAVECQQWCKVSDGCKAWSYFTKYWKKKCSLYTKVEKDKNGNLLNVVPGTTSGYNPCGVTSCWGKKKFANGIRPTKGAPIAMVRSAEECIKACDPKNDCNYVTLKNKYNYKSPGVYTCMLYKSGQITYTPDAKNWVAPRKCVAAELPCWGEGELTVPENLKPEQKIKKGTAPIKSGVSAQECQQYCMDTPSCNYVKMHVCAHCKPAGTKYYCMIFKTATIKYTPGKKTWVASKQCLGSRDN